ncbi:hypothetical protein CHUAL_001260 [Chamberlinius hualienensis]
MISIDIGSEQNFTHCLEKLPKSCRLLLTMLKLVGINIGYHSSEKQTNGYMKWLHRACIFVFGTTNSSYLINCVMNGVGTGDLWILCYFDFIFVYTFLYVISTRENEIRNFTANLIQTAFYDAHEDVVVHKIDKMSKFLIILLILPTPYLPIFIYYHIEMSKKCAKWFELGYYGYSTTPTSRGILAAALSLSYSLVTIITALYSIVLIFLIFLLSICYENINNSFKRLKVVSVTDISQYQEKNHKLNQMISQFNILFSPVVLVFVVILMGAIIGTPGSVNAIYTWQSLFFDKSSFHICTVLADILVPFVKATVFMLILLQMTTKTHQLSKSIFNQLVESSNNHPEIYDDLTKNLITHCTKINLFLSEWMISPATITASGLFTLDYALVGVASIDG